MFVDPAAPGSAPAPEVREHSLSRILSEGDAATFLRALARVRFVRFLLVAALNTAFGYALFAGLILFGVWYPIAAAVGTVIGVLFNFQTTGRLVFGSHDISLIFRFFAVYAISYVVGVFLLRWADHHGISVLVAAAVLALPMGLFSFTLQRLLVFRRPR